MTTSAPIAQPDTAPSPDAPAPTFRDAVIAFKRQLLVDTLATTAGNRTSAARVLGLQRTYLQRLIRELGVTPPRGADWPS